MGVEWLVLKAILALPQPDPQSPVNSGFPMSNGNFDTSVVVFQSVFSRMYLTFNVAVAVEHMC